MKRYGNLFDRICDLDNIREAHRNARKGKTGYRSVQRVDADIERHVLRIRELLTTGQYKTAEYRVFERLDNGKRRIIYALPYFPDRIIHHCIMQVVEPIWQATFIRDTYASMKNRGVHDGVSRIKKALQSDPDGTRYCLKMDVQQFYPSIDHDILKTVVRRKIKDARLLELLDEIIDSVPSGVPIGNYLSQYFGNLFLSAIDHAAKEDLRIRHYFRYCDDIVVLAEDKTKLHSVRDWFAEKLAAIRLTLKPNWQVFPVEGRGVDFLGYRFFHGKTLVRRRIAYKFKRQMRKLRRNWHRIDPLTLLSSVMSYYGWTKVANAGRLFLTHVTPALRRRVLLRCGPTLEGAMS